MRWFGLRDFKLKLGLGEQVDAANLRVVTRRIGRAVRKGTCTLRVDVNGGWEPDQLPERAARLAGLGVCAIEQPCFVPAARLVELARTAALPLMADESLLTADDAEILAVDPGRVWWNVRIGKNGGIGPTLDLLARARRAGTTVTLGCMVGETSLLSAWQRVVLAAAPVTARFVEGNYGRFLLRADPVRPHLRFGFGGRLGPLGKGRIGAMRVDRRQLAAMGEKVADLRV
jgi:L-alanine-DL-glutamate epimerase-like enolase superfamily enzyme